MGKRNERLIARRDERVATDGWTPVADENQAIDSVSLLGALRLRRRCPRCGLVTAIWRHKAPFFGSCPGCSYWGRNGGWVIVERHDLPG
jgi:hypothetical protein